MSTKTIEPTLGDWRSMGEWIESGRDKQSRPIGNNTRLEFETIDGGLTIGIRLHATVVVRYGADGTVEFDSGGWKSPTTADRMNWNGLGYQVFSNKGEWRISRRDNARERETELIERYGLPLDGPGLGEAYGRPQMALGNCPTGRESHRYIDGQYRKVKDTEGHGFFGEVAAIIGATDARRIERALRHELEDATSYPFADGVRFDKAGVLIDEGHGFDPHYEVERRSYDGRTLEDLQRENREWAERKAAKMAAAPEPGEERCPECLSEEIERAAEGRRYRCGNCGERFDAPAIVPNATPAAAADPNDAVNFGTLHSDGTRTEERSIGRSDIRACPHVIFVADHYRPDGSCRCDEKDNPDMAGWGYRWDEQAGRWI